MKMDVKCPQSGHRGIKWRGGAVEGFFLSRVQLRAGGGGLPDMGSASGPIDRCRSGGAVIRKVEPSRREGGVARAVLDRAADEGRNSRAGIRR